MIKGGRLYVTEKKRQWALYIYLFIFKGFFFFLCLLWIKSWLVGLGASEGYFPNGVLEMYIRKINGLLCACEPGCNSTFDVLFGSKTPDKLHNCLVWIYIYRDINLIICAWIKSLLEAST